VGADSFIYRVRDEYGNYSDECKVNLEIKERTTDAVLTDMYGHWAHSAALSAFSDGSLEVISENGKLYFDPYETITREDFLKAVMTALGAPNLPETKTVFADDSDISEGLGGYVAAAYELGIVKGTMEAGRLSFNPADAITRAEAAVILNRILGATTDGLLPAFSDIGSIPTWAKADMHALANIGILNGNGNSLHPTSTVTRAQTAQMLYTAKNLYE